jgi:transmembrane sensor
MNNQERLNFLLTRRLDGNITISEAGELDRYIDEDSGIVEEALLKLLSRHAESNDEMEAFSDTIRMHDTLKKVLQTDKTPPSITRKKPFFPSYHTIGWIAASVLFIILSTASFLYFTPYFKRPLSEQAVASFLTSEIPVDYIRTIVLPDSSLVVLQAGSMLSFPKDFGKGAREVQLVGEAYFDIRKISGGKPFIIHSGKIKTTVLGTSFNIKAYPDQADIVVSVVKGKVQIEDQSQILAILTEDQQISYNTEAKEHVEERMTALKATEWTRGDLEFTGESFEEIALVLTKRFDVTIDILNPSLKKCITKATFSGTESLENLLEMLCTLRGAHFQFESPSHILIDGEGC